MMNGRSVLAAVGVGLVLSMTTWFSATAVLGDLQGAFGLSAGAASWLTNAVQVGFVLAALSLSVSGLADALPAPRLMAGCALVAALANLSILVAPGAPALFAARVVTGAALAGVYPPALKLIATWIEKGRGLAMGAAVGALTLGSSLPYLFKALGASFDWHVVILLSGGAALLSSALFYGASEGPFAAKRSAPDLTRSLAVLSDRDLALANLGYFGHMWELYAMWGWFLAFATEALRLHPRLDVPTAATLTFLVVAVGSLGCLFGGYLADRIGRTATTALMMIISGSCALGIGLTIDGPSWLFVTVALVWGFTIIADSAQFSAMATELAGARNAGAALALQVGVGFALTIVSIRLTPLLGQAIGWRWTFAMLAPGPFIGAAAMLVLRTRSRAVAIAGGLR